jgi:hypothetical protein
LGDLLIAQHICANRTGNEASDRTQSSTTKLVSQKRAAGTSYKG